MTDLWGPIAVDTWGSVPCVAGRCATEADVVAGRAVFYVQGPSAAAPMQLPCCAVQVMEDGSEQSVVVIQAELARDTVVLGVRPLAGGNGVYTISEVRLLPQGFGE